MELNQVLGLLSEIHGCTFASLDAETKPSPGFRKTVEGENVLLFTNKNSSGYENMVRRRLKAAGLDPDSFRLGPLPWGTRLPDTPIIEHKREYYIQTICVRPGKVRAFIGLREVDPADLPWLKGHENSGQGLPKGDQVVVKTYALRSIKTLTLKGVKIEG